MSVYPERRKGRLTGKWIAEVTRNGERIARKSFALKRDADTWEGSLALGQPIEPEQIDTGPTFAEVAKEMLAAKPKAADPSGQRRLEFIIGELGSELIREIDETRLDKLVAKLKKRSGKQTDALSPGTLNRYLSEASGVFHFAKVRKLVTATPTIPWQEDSGHRLEWLPENKEAAFLAAMADPACNTVARVLIATGVRWGELAGLEPEQIEPETGWLRLWVTKNGKSRSAPIPSDLAGELKQLVSSKALPSYSTFRNCLQAAAKSAGLSAKFSIHALRHTTATRLLHKGVPLAIVQKYLGHKTIQTTLKYTHVADDDLQNALKKISPHAGQTAKTPQSDAA